jgi:hypothetical protein
MPLCPSCDEDTHFHLHREFERTCTITETLPCLCSDPPTWARTRVIELSEDVEQDATWEADGRLDWFPASILDEQRELVRDDVACADCVSVALASEYRSERGAEFAEDSTEPTASCSACEEEFEVECGIEAGRFVVHGLRD